MAFWTFDYFHAWHKYYLMEAEKLGKTLIVVIARDRRVEKIKWHLPFHDALLRRYTVAKNFPHAHVILGDEYDIFVPIDQYAPDILACWYDQDVPEELIRKRYPNLKMVRIRGFKPEILKSSKIRDNIDNYR